MKKLPKLLFATLLTTAAILSMPPASSAADWCGQCDLTGDCYACCRCGGGAPGHCAFICG